MFSYEICEIFKNIYFEGNLRTTASDAALQPMSLLYLTFIITLKNVLFMNN